MEDKFIKILRENISKIDDQLIELLIARFHYSYMVGVQKKKNNIPIVNDEVMKSITKKYVNGLGIHGEEIYKLIHSISVKIQEYESNDL
jgi:hypothetical protein